MYIQAKCPPASTDICLEGHCLATSKKVIQAGQGEELLYKKKVQQGIKESAVPLYKKPRPFYIKSSHVQCPPHFRCSLICTEKMSYIALLMQKSIKSTFLPKKIANCISFIAIEG